MDFKQRLTRLEHLVRDLLKSATKEKQTQVSVSNASYSSPVLSSGSGGLSVNSPLLRNVNAKQPVSFYKMPKGNLTNSYDDVASNGSMTTATITNVEGFDRIVVGGSTIDSYIRLNKLFTLSRFRIKIKIRIEAIGSTAPLFGMRAICPGGYVNFCNAGPNASVNLLTGAITGDFPSGEPSAYIGWSGAAVVGDTIEMLYDYEYSNFASVSFGKTNTLTGETSVANRVFPSQGSVFFPSIVLSDGTYTLLDFEILSTDYNPTLAIVGDSMGASTTNESVLYHFEKNSPFKGSCLAAPAQLLSGMLASQWEIFHLKPKYVVMYNYLDPLYYQNANPANGGYATWSANYLRYVKTLKMMGYKIIFLLPETWFGFVNSTTCGYFSDFVNTNFPTDIKIIIPTSESFSNDGIHYHSITNLFIATKIIEAMQADGGFTA